MVALNLLVNLLLVVLRGRGPAIWQSPIRRNYGRSRSRFYINRGNKTVSPPRQSLNIPGPVCRIAECLAQPVDGIIQPVVEVSEGVGRPQFLSQLLSRHHLTGTLQQTNENLERLILKLDLAAVLAELTRPQISFKGPKLCNPPRGNWLFHGSPRKDGESLPDQQEESSKISRDVNNRTSVGAFSFNSLRREIYRNRS